MTIRAGYSRVMVRLMATGLALCALPTVVSADALSLPGIPPSGLPNFDNNVNVSVSRVSSGFVLSASLRSRSGADIKFNHPSGSYNISETNDSFTLTANFDKWLNLIPSSSFVEIKGTPPAGVPGASYATTNPLWKAGLVDWNIGFTSSWELILGFETGAPSNSWAKQFCGPNCHESVYFEDLDNFATGPAWDFYQSASNHSDSYWKKSKNGVLFTFTGHAITTVPLPAGVWLFGSGLLGLIRIARRKRDPLEAPAMA